MRTFPSLAAAALAASVPLSLALAAGLPIGDEPAAAAATQCPASLVESARQLLRDGKPVAARAELLRVFQGAASADEAQAREAMTLLGEANRRIRDLDPLSLSLQKAELALQGGDVRTAERHLQAVVKSAAVTPRQLEAAKGLQAQVDTRRAELAPTVPEALAQAERDFRAGRLAEAKAGLERVDRSGVALTEEQQAALDGYQVKLVSLASADPALFGRPSMGMLQPGVIRRRDEQPAAPAGEQPPPAPAPTPAPAAQPEQPPPAPPPAQPAVDPIAQAQRFEAQSLLAQADKAFDERRLNEAQGRYFRLQSEYRDYLTPEQLRHVENRLQETRVMMAAPGTAPRPEDVIREQEIARQRLIAEFTSDVNEARRALQTGDVNEARTRAASARLRINSGRTLLSQTEYEAMNNQVGDLLAQVDRAEAQIRADAQRQAEEERQRAAAEAQRIARARKEQQIVELIDRARAYQAEMRYDEALQAIEQLLFLDPINPTGLLLRDLIVDIRLYVEANKIYDRKQIGYAVNSLDNQEAAIPPANIINYPLDWPALSVRRGEPLQFAETPENRAAMAQLNATKIPTVAFNNNPLEHAVQFLSTIAHQNIDVDWTSLEEAGITRETPVTLNLTNVTAKTALDRVVEKISGLDRNSRADWAVLDGVVTVASDERIRKNTILHIYDVRDLLLDVPDYRDVPRIDLQQALQASQGGGGGGQSPFREEDQDDEQERRELDERLDDIISIITSNVDYDGWVDNGGDTGKIQKHQGSLIITNTPKNHRQVVGLLSKLREIRAMQINVETRFLLVNQDWFEQIGFDLDVYINGNNNQIRAARTFDPTVQPGDFFTDGRLNREVAGATRRWPAVLTPVTPANPQPNTGTGVLTQGLLPPKGFSPIGFESDSLGLGAALAPQRGIASTILGQAPALGIAGQFLDDVQVDFLIRATQADRRSIQLTAPRLTFTNGQIANIYVATQQAFISDLTPVVGDSAVGFDPTVGVVTEGVTLLVEGTVTADRRYVQLNVDAGVARIDGFGQQPVTAVAGGQLVASADTQSFIQLPRVTVTRVRTTVTVPDQGTILMGGQRLVSESEVETGVPVLSKVPILNRFFTNRIESKEEQTLLILLKPTILIQNEEEERQFPGLLESYRGLGG